MSSFAKHRLAVGAVGLAVLAGAGGAYAAGQSSGSPPKPAAAPAASEQNAFLDDVAKRLGVTRDKLDDAIKGAAEARIDAAVAAGKLTKEQGEAAKQRLANGGGPLLGLGGRPGGRGPGGGPGGPGGPRFGFQGLDGAASYLGLTEAQLRDQLGSGKSLADIAKAQNKDVAGLKTALKDALTKRLDEAVKDGHLTADQRTKILEGIDQRLDDLINGKGPGGHRGFGFRHP
ncbi:MAG TPA: hypothetical protein VNS09_06800 [Solirubrobacter sp.]|nr:hypothetical protein [Solirubrobacter sp.]